MDTQQLDWLKPHAQAQVLGGPKGLIIGVGHAGTQMLCDIPWPEGIPLSVIALDCDLQSLACLGKSIKTMSIGMPITRGYGCGADPAIGLEVVKSASEEIKILIQDYEWIAIIGGLGGGMASAATSFIAQLAKDKGIWVVAVVAMPFQFEGTRRAQIAAQAVQTLQSHAHVVLTLHNQVLLQELDEQASIFEAFKKTQQWTHEALRSFWNLLYYPGPVKVDFSLLKHAFSNAQANILYGLGLAQGTDVIAKALQNLFLCPLLHIPGVAQRAAQLVVSIRSGYAVGLHELDTMVSAINKRFSSQEQTLWSYAYEASNPGDWLHICVLGTTKNATDVGPCVVINKKSTSSKPTIQNPSSKETSKQDKQREFDFFEHNVDQRGAFYKTSTNFFQGQDLDVPTYLRQGIKIKL